MPSSPLSSTSSSSSSSSTSSSSQQQQSQAPGSTNIFVNAWSRFHDGHERLKNAVHSYWRQNTFLSPRHTAGKVVMGCVYFSIPVIAAYFGVNKLVDATESAAHEQRVRGSNNNNNSNNNSNGNSSDNSNNSSAMIGGTEEAQSIGTVGAGGWGGGVRLAGNDRVTQDVNRINLERFMRKQRKLKEKREREEAAAAAAAAAAAQD